MKEVDSKTHSQCMMYSGNNIRIFVPRQVVKESPSLLPGLRGPMLTPSDAQFN